MNKKNIKDNYILRDKNNIYVKCNNILMKKDMSYYLIDEYNEDLSNPILYDRDINQVYIPYKDITCYNDKFDLSNYTLVWDRNSSNVENFLNKVNLYWNKILYKINCLLKKEKKTYLDKIVYGIDKMPDWFMDKVASNDIILSSKDKNNFNKDISNLICYISNSDQQIIANGGDIIALLPNKEIVVYKDFNKFNRDYKKIEN